MLSPFSLFLGIKMLNWSLKRRRRRVSYGFCFGVSFVFSLCSITIFAYKNANDISIYVPLFYNQHVSLKQKILFCRTSAMNSRMVSVGYSLGSYSLIY